ncbi:MAG: cytochrome P450 [Actinobacteria bacterium]|nr:cytochrome P450 [Actinomycetota bacterium]
MSEPITLTLRRQRTFDPAPELEELLESGRSLHPLRFRGGEVGWLVTGYREARALLNDSRFTLRPWPPLLTEDPTKHAAYVEMMDRTGLIAGEMLAMDPPEHTRLRRVLAPRFSTNAIKELAPAVEEVVGRCLGEMEAAGRPADLVERFATPIPERMHCVLLGVPETDIPMLEKIGETISDQELSIEEVTRATGEFRDYLQEVVARKRAEPGDDLMTHIIATGELTDDEILGLLVLLFIAGVDTTASMLATGTFALLCHADQLALLRADPTLVDATVEELMRYLTVFNIGTLTRTATEDVEIDGGTIRAGDLVSVSLLGANRDGERFEHPDELDVHRGGKGQIGFGHGVHVCLGQHLARLEMRVALTRLLERFPDLRVAVPTDEVPLSGEGALTFAVEALPVTW